jgi:hypothetical protein
MTDEKIIRLVRKEIRSKQLGVTQQLLGVHEVIC